MYSTTRVASPFFCSSCSTLRVRTLNALPGNDAVAVLGGIDAVKLRSCLTVFAEASQDEALFREALDKYFHAQPDAASLSLLGRTTR